MKKIILLTLFISFINSNCTQNNNSMNSLKMNYTQIPTEKQLSYMIELNMKLPYELYVNDIKASYDYIGANSGVDINPYLLKNGKCKIKIKIFPSFKAGKKVIDIDDLKNSTVSFGKYIMDKKKNDIHSYNTTDFTLLNYTLPNSPIPYFEQEWEVDIKELPYDLEGWSKGQDLSKMDKKELEKKVVDYYKKLWTMLNNGDASIYQSLWGVADKELVIYDYLAEDNYQKATDKNMLDVKKCKDMMIPLEDYEVKLYAEGKIVSLERKTHTLDFNNESPLDIKGWSALIRKYKVSGGASYGAKLYLPQGSKDFVIIRK